MRYSRSRHFTHGIIVLGLYSVCLADATAAAGADWLERFRFHPPESETSGLCLPGDRSLPTFTVAPVGTGRQLVRVSLPFAPGSLPAEVGLALRTGDGSIEPDVQVLTLHPGRPRSVRRAIITFVHEFADNDPVTFSCAWKAGQNAGGMPTSQPGPAGMAVGDLQLRVGTDAVAIRKNGSTLWHCEFIAPGTTTGPAPVTEILARGKHYLWLRLLVPDERWPRILEVRADALGTVAIRGHVQRLEPTDDVVARAPDIGWRLRGPAVTSMRVGGNADRTGGQAASGTRNDNSRHLFSRGERTEIVAGGQRIDLPDAHLLRRGSIQVASGTTGGEIVYLRSRDSDRIPMQYAAWRTATVVLGPVENSPWTALLEPPHRVRVEAEAFDAIYDSGKALDLAPWKLLAAVNEFHIEAIAPSTLTGDDFGNVTSMPRSSVYGMNRLNHCPPIFEEYYRTGDHRLRNVAVHWCENYHDLSIWWGPAETTKFGGTRYNNISAHGERPPDPDYMWRSNSAVSFCTKGIDSFFYAYEETGDPRMATALRWQTEYAAREVHADTGECRNIGDVADWMRLYRFTGNRAYFEAGLRLFRELRTKLSPGNLFDQGGKPIEQDPPFIEEDKVGLKHPYAKPYILGYALSGLPALAREVPDEPKVREVIRAVADFQAQAQDPTGGWRYPHPNSSGTIISQGIEHAMQLSRAAAYLERRGEPIENLLDAIERTLQSRVLGWQRSGQFLAGLGGWEKAAGILKEGQTLYDLYAKPADRDPSRDYTEGQVSVGGSAPDGVVYFSEVLAFYLAHRPAERLLHANEVLGKVLARIPAKQSSFQAPQPSGDYLPYGVADQLPTFREALLGRLTFPLAWDPSATGLNAASFRRWRQQARAKVLECLLTPPPRADFAPAVIAREDRGTYEARKIVFNVSADCRIPAYLLVPKGQGPFPAVVALHDHGAYFLIGKEKMIRPFGVPPEIATAAKDWADKCYGGRFVGDALAERGYVVFSMDALYWGERGRREGVDYHQQQALAANLLQMGTTWLGQVTWDDMRAADFVASLPEVDPERVGAVGLSMGSHRTWMLHAVSDRIAAAAGVCWMGTTASLMAPGNNQTKGHSSYSMMAPNLRNLLDFPDVAAIACPKPLLLFDGGIKDKLFPLEGLDAAYARLHRVWESQRVGHRLVTQRWDVGHVFNVEMQEEAFAWLDRWLKKPANDITVAAYYYPCEHPDPRWDKAKYPGFTEWDLIRKAKPRFPGHKQPRVPLWGYTDESDPTVMAQKIDASADHGVDAFIFDWYYYDDGPYLAGALERGFLEAPNNHRLEFGLMWANHDWYDIQGYNPADPIKLLYPGKVAPATWEKITDRVIERYFKHPSYWKIDGKPYFSVYDMGVFLDSFGSVEAARKAVDGFRAKVRAAGLPGLHFNAVLWGQPNLPGGKTPANWPRLCVDLGIDSLTGYTWVHHGALNYSTFPVSDYVAGRDVYLKFWERAMAEYPVPYFPNTTINWDNSPRAHPDAKWDKPALHVVNPVMVGNTPAAFQEACRIIRDRLLATPTQPKIVTVNAWNEWPEGSVLEPDAEHGYGYLEALRAVFGTPRR